ncbi:Hypothetical predicted protein [Cloeon dipterum]|uniref:Myotubularin phosphatase domain-containing protein n=1 Tax=Cloeon dipterum TaxID=197152 RepID=A0A8S1DNE0_9INSE|nr:Hypothetical predicted protein [Cloeon dipterum]
MLKELIPRAETVNDKISRLISARLPWQFAVGEDGKVVAVIEDTMLEIRTSRDEYSSVIGKASIARDHFPQYRKAVWSPDCSLLACAFSSGKIGLYDLLGSNILNIEPKVPSNEEWPNANEAISGILFLEDRVKSPKWSYELIAIDYKGNLRSFLVSPTEGFREHHTFNFSSYYRNGITTVSLLQPGNLLLLAGPSDIQMDQKGRGSSAGISAWRVLSDHPYYSPAFSSEEDLLNIQGPRGIWNWLPSFRSSQQSDVLAMRVSPQRKYLACIHTSGAISLWYIPSLRLFKHWNLRDQPDHNVINPQIIQGIQDKTKYNENCIDYLPVDISWWSENVLIISRYSGAVSVCSISDLQNLLGESPEFFAGCPQISAAYGDGKGFLSLECEVNFTRKKKSQFDDSLEEEELDEGISSDEAEISQDASMLGRGAGAVKAALYWATDSDKFKPPRANPKIMKRTYRLLGLKSTTPEELYSRKIDNEEYGEALQLARAYGLDCDLVYQRQWRSKKVSVATIHDYLSKISKRSWVLKECADRVPETAAAARELLQFGLHATSKRVLFSVATSSEESMTGLELKESVEESEDYEDVNTSDLLQEDLNVEQTDIIRSRQKLLRYMDMLSTYELILGKESDVLYNLDFYAKFRMQSPLKSAIEFARNGSWQAVSTMLTYHSHCLMKHRLPIISNLPETIDPHDYRSLLPECDEEEVVPWITDILRDQDWCETFYFRMEEDDGKIMYEDDPSLLQFAEPVLDKDLVGRWYVARATALEERSKMVDHALSLISLGQARGVPGLESLFGELSTLEMLVYEVQVEELSLSGLRKYNDLEQAHLLVSKSTSDSFVSDCKSVLLPHLMRCEAKQPGRQVKLFHNLLVDISRSSLVLPLQVFRHFKNDSTCELIKSEQDVLSLALDCIYAYPGTDQLDIALQLINCLPEKSYGEKSKEILELYNQIDRMHGHLIAAEILSHHANLSMPMFKLRDMGSDEKSSFMTLTQMARSLTKRTPTATQSQWSALLTDMLSLQAKVFSCIELEKCFEIYAETLLASGHKANIRYAGSIMECSKSESHEGNEQKIRYDTSVALILKASREYFDSSESLSDSSMDYAKSCLLLITDENDEIKEELDLIASLQILKDFGVSILPIQVRLTPNKLKLLRDCLKARATAYRNSQRLLQLANFLRICKEDPRAREASVLNLIAEAALNANDYNCCADVCQKMMDKSHSSGWEIARKLSECEDYLDISVKRRLLAFATLNCEPSAMQELIKQSQKLELQMLHERIGSKMADGAVSSFSALSPTNDDFCDALSSPEVERKEFTIIPKIIQQSASVLKNKTRNVLQNIGNETYWKSAFDWLPQTGNERSSITDRVFTQGFHTFYSNLHGPKCHESGLGYHYDSFAMQTIDPTIDLLISIVRVSILEEISDKDTEDVGLNDDIILKAAKNLSQAKELFLQLPRSIVTLQTAAYYFALKVCLEELSNEDFEARSDASLTDPFKLIHLVNQNKIPGCTSTDVSTEARKLLASFIALQGEFLQTLQLQSLNCGVDPLRFSHDVQYRHDSIIGLAMTDDIEQLELAQSLAEKYEIPPSQLAVSYLTHLLLDERGVNHEKLMDAVTEQEEHLSPDIIGQLEKQVLPHIAGTDHLRLVSYYTVLQKISDSTLYYGLPPSHHIKLIKKVKATSNDIDYKVLSSNPDELLRTLPGALRCTIQPGELYRAWMLKLFFQVSKNSTDEQWQGKFNICKEHFSKLNASEFEDVAAELIFSRDAYNHISRMRRLEFLAEMLKFCRGRQQIEEWGVVASKLQTWNDHLELYTADVLENLTSAQSSEYAKRMEMSRGDEATVEVIVDEIILCDLPLSLVSTLLSLRTSDLSLSIYLTKKLQQARESARWDLVCASLKRLNQLFREVPDLQLDKQLLKAQIEPLCADPDIDPAVRLQALKITPRIARKSTEDVADEVDGKSCALYTTQAVLASAWPNSQEVSVRSEDLESPQTRNKLFDSLLNEARSWQQLVALSEVLKAWHLAGLECSDLWTQLVPKMLESKECSQGEIYELLHDIVRTKAMPSEGLLELIQPMQDIGHKLQLYLLNEDAILKEQAVILFENEDADWEAIVDSDLITMLLERNVVINVISTPVYPYILAFLLKEEATEQIEEVVECLLRAGHKAEAGSLLLQAKRSWVSERAIGPIVIGNAVYAMTHSFKSYIDIKEDHFGAEELDPNGTKKNVEQCQPRLLEGEAVTAAEDNVLQFVSLCERKHGRSGTLFVTNFKLSFVPCVSTEKEGPECQKSRLLGEFDVSLCNIDCVYHITREKKRKLIGGQNVSSKIKGLLIVCKNMRTLTYSFKFSSVNSGKNIANALLHYAFPRRHHLLFAYDYREPNLRKSRSDILLFQEQSDWMRELKNSNCAGWRITSSNTLYNLSANLPSFFVVPESALDWQLETASRHFRDNRPPVWCWGTTEGAALVRMADMLPGINDRVQENIMLEQVRKAHPKKRQPQIFDLQKSLPTPRDLQISFGKLRDICSPESASRFWNQEQDFFGRMDSTRWLHYVSGCLAIAQQAANALASGETIVLQEGEGRDVSTIVSSLVQLMCNPSCRSILGFQSLIQKEWIALGHPFCSRLGLIAESDVDQSPMFLLFLDCVWQILNQFPGKFEFTETYLTTLWDSCHVGIFDTFLFNSERDRAYSVTDAHNPLHLRSVWDWEEQYGPEDIALFRNPLYALEAPVQIKKLQILPVSCGLSALEVWQQCYCRWVPMLEVRGGGRVQVNFQVRLLADEIIELKKKADAWRRGLNPDRVPPFSFSEELTFACDSAVLRDRLRNNPGSFFPFMHHSAVSAGEVLLSTSILGDEDEMDERDCGLNESTYSLSTAV